MLHPSRSWILYFTLRCLIAMSTSELKAEGAPSALAPSSTLPPAHPRTDRSSSSSGSFASLNSIFAELQLEQVVKSWWRGSSYISVHFSLSPALCVVETVRQKQQTLALPWEAVLGAHVLTADGVLMQPRVDVPPDASFLLGVFACVGSSRKQKSLKTRQMMEFFFQFRGKQMHQVLKLHQVINFAADPRNHATIEKVKSFDQLKLVEQRPRKFLVLVNPVSGPGRALQIYNGKVAPVLRYANVETEVKVMDHANHAMEIVSEIPLGVYDCVVAVGGDGSLYEIVQGLMKRSDWHDAIRQPLGVIPGGSGNGLAESIFYQGDEKRRPINAAFILAKGAPQNLDIASVRNGKETVYSFLSLEWASIADVDIGSEKFRMLGGLRFTIAFVYQLLIQRPVYSGKIWYLEESEDENAPPYFESQSVKLTDHPAMDLFDNGQGPPVDSRDVQSKGQWKQLSGQFRIVWVMNVSHAASDALLAPEAKFDDGYYHITYMSGDYSRKDLLAMMIAIESGTHVGKKGVQQVRTRAIKLVPERSADLMCVDGEVMEGPYLEAQVHRGMARIVALSNGL